MAPAIATPDDKLKVFISYSRQDQAFADAVCGALEGQGFHVLIDRRDLPYGEEWQRELGDFIRTTDAVVWLVSPASLASTWCHWELGEVTHLHKRLVPVKIRDIAIDTLPPAVGKIHLLPAEGVFTLEQHLAVLRDTLNTDYAWTKDATRLAERARQWLAKGRDTSLLLAGAALRDAETWSMRKPKAAPPPAGDILELILASKRGAARRQRRLIAAALSVAVISLGLAAVAYWQRGIAQENQRQAEAERDRALVAQSRAMASLSNQLRGEGDTTRSTLVGIEAVQKAHSSRQHEAPFVTEVEEYLLASLSRLREQAFVAPGDGRAASATFNSDGSQLVVATQHYAHVIDTATGKVLRRLDGHKGHVDSAVFSPDGAMVLTASGDGTARLWDAASGAQVAALQHDKAVGDARYSPDGTRFLTASADGKIRVWDARSRRLLLTLADSRNKPDDEDFIRIAVFTPDGRQIVAAHGDKGVARLWDLASRRMIAEFNDGSPDVEVYAAAVSPDGTRLVMGGSGGDVSLFDLKTRQKKLTLRGHDGRVFTVAFSPDGSRVATGSRDATVRLWDAMSGDSVAILRGHAGSVYRVEFSRDGRRLASASQDGEVRIWDATFAVESQMRPGDPSLRAEKPKPPDASAGEFITFSADRSRALKFNEQDPYLTEVWDVRANRRIASVRGLSGVVNGAELSPDGSKVVTAERNGKGQVWDVAADKLLFELSGHGDQMQDVKFSPDGKLIASASRDGTARLWDPSTGAQIFAYHGHKGPVDSVSFSPDSARLLTAGDDGAVRVWSTRSGTEILALRTHEAHQGAVSSSAEFSRDGRFVFLEAESTSKVIEIGLSGQELVTQAMAAVSRCLTLEQRRQLSLEPEPPPWCIEMEKWPYGIPGWKQWLADKRAGRNPELPKSP